jgi:monofunctional biosynthetic peptidoglycan transglycosylase
VLLWFFAVSLFFVVIYKFVPVPFTPLMVIRAVENSADKKENSFSHDWESIEIFLSTYRKLLLQVKTGFIHNGFDFKAMQKHIKVMREVGK